MGHEHRDANRRRADATVGDLAAAHGLDVDLAHALYREAQRRSHGDEYRRSSAHWFARLAATVQRPHVPDYGRRTHAEAGARRPVQPAAWPGKRLGTDQLQRGPAIQAKATGQ